MNSLKTWYGTMKKKLTYLHAMDCFTSCYFEVIFEVFFYRLLFWSYDKPRSNLSTMVKVDMVNQGRTTTTVPP